MFNKSHPAIDDPFLRAHVEETEELYGKLNAALDHVDEPLADLNTVTVVTRLAEEYSAASDDVQLNLSLAGFELLQADDLTTDIPEFDIQAHAALPISERVAFRKRLRRKLAYLRNFKDTHMWWHSFFADMCEGLFRSIPDDYSTKDGIEFAIPYIDALPDVGEVIERAIIREILREQVEQYQIFVSLRNQLEENLKGASSAHRELILPTHPKIRDADPRRLASMYLGGTPLLPFFTDSTVSLTIPEKAWFEAAWCIAPPGTGKTQLIQFLISERLPEVERDECSVIVIDSQADLINQIRSLKCFAPGQPLHDKLIVIEPDLAFPPALNIFDFGRERLKSYSPNDREKFTNIAITQMTYVLDALMGEGGAMTTKQETLYRYIVRLLMELPDATLSTFRDILQITKPAELIPYQSYIDRLHQPAQDFFRDQFLDSEFAATKRQVAWRIANLRENNYFNRMFSHPRSKLDLFSELNSSKVILVNTDKERLGEDGTNVFGRYFIGALLTASQERASLPHTGRLPVYCFVDECQDYIATDSKVAALLDQARKMRVSMFLAHQRSKQIRNPNVLDALSNTAIRFANTDNPADADLTAKALHTTKELVGSQPNRHFALYVRRQTPSAVSVRIPFFVLEEMEKMTDEDQEAVRRIMRERYATAFEEGPEGRAVAGATMSTHATEGPPNPSSDAPTSDLDNPDW